MQQQLNTPEDLRAIRQAMDEGKNPLVETDVPRWEDQVGISRIVNRRVLEFEVLPTPAQVLGDLPLSEQAQEIVAYSRDEIRACLYGQDDRLLVVVGPCSVHDPKAALDYARRLSALKGELDGELLIVMRVYFEKPRTTLGWKGLVYDPDLDSSFNIEKGLRISRKLLMELVRMELPAATEFLDPIMPQYFADLITWAAIGARTVESQTHRQLASGLPMAVGFKNATDGTFQTAIDAISTALSEHSFIGVLEDGHVGVFRTRGNPYAHIVLRGGNGQPNYGAEHIAFLKVAMQKAHLKPSIIVDCSHANSGKDYRKQHVALEDVLSQIEAGETAIRGVMLESNLLPGSQKIVSGCRPTPGLSVTDGCIGWDETAELIRSTYARLAAIHPAAPASPQS